MRAHCGLSAVVAASVILAAFGPAMAKPLKPGDPAPDFTVTTFDGRKIAMSDLRGKVIVLNYWATWCGPCRRELPLMDSYYRKAKDKGLAIFAIATEDSVPQRFLKPLSQSLSFPLISKLKAKGYGLIDSALPTNYVIDRNGVIRRAKAGAFEVDDLLETLNPLLAEPAPAPAAATTPAP